MFSIRPIFSLRQILAVAALALASAGALAGTGKVTAADLERVEHAWQANPDQAVAMLQEMQTTLQETGHADEIRTVSDVYWRHARATLDVNCKASYRSLYQATVLGFTEQWPQRAVAYQALAYNLQQCLPRDMRTELGQQAWGVLRTSKLRDVVDITRVEKAGLNAVLELPERPAQAAPASATEAAPRIDVDGLMKIVQPIIAIAVGAGIVLSTFGVIFGGSSGSNASSSASTTPAAPAKRTGRDAANQRTSKAKTSRLQRARLVRMRPWG